MVKKTKRLVKAHEMAELVATRHQVMKFREVLFTNGQRRYEVKDLEEMDYAFSEDDEVRGEVPEEMTKWTYLDAFTASAVHQVYNVLMQTKRAEEHQTKFNTFRFTTIVAFAFRACK